MIQECSITGKPNGKQRVSCGSDRLLLSVLGFAGTNQGCDGDCKGRLLQQQAVNWQCKSNQWAMLMLPYAKLHVAA